MGIEKDQIKFLSEKYKLSEEQVKEIITSPFRLINEKSKGINIKGDETEEEFNNKTFNYNLPYIGKLYASFYKFLSIHNRKDELQRRK